MEWRGQRWRRLCPPLPLSAILQRYCSPTSLVFLTDIDEEAALHAHMAQASSGNNNNPDGVGSHIGSEDSESMQQLDFEREFGDSDSASSGKPVALSTQCQIIAPGNKSHFRSRSSI